MSDLWTPLATKEAAIEAMDAGSDSHWIDEAERAIRWLWERREHDALLTADAVWALLSIWKVEPPKERRALAVAFARAQRAGLIRITSETKQSVRPENHGRRISAWRIVKP